MINLYEINKSNNRPALHSIKKIKSNNLFGCKEDIQEFFNQYFNMNKLYYERSYVVAFDEDLKPIGIILIGDGDRRSYTSVVHKIFTFLILIGANSYISIHNHPNGTSSPSTEDYEISSELNNIGNEFNIFLMNSYIIYNNGIIEY